MKRQIAAAMACMLMLVGCGNQTNTSEQPTKPTGTAVAVQTVSRTNLSNEHMVSGQVIADSSVSVIPTTAGTVQKLPVKAGDSVEKGQLLFQIDVSQVASSYSAMQKSYSATQQMTNEAIQTAQTALPIAQSAVTTAQTNYDNTLALFNVGAVAQVELDQARIQLEQAKSQLAQAQSSVEQARASQRAQLAQMESSMSQMRSQIEGGTVTAPCSGLITAVNVTEGGMAGQSGPAIVIAEGGRTRIGVQVSEDLLGQLKVGDVAQVTISAVSTVPFAASVASIAPAADPQTALYEVRLYTPEGTTYPIGAFADVTFFTNQRQDTITIPSDAILLDGTTQYVYVVEENIAHKVVIETGIAGNGITEVTQGLLGEEQLVTQGQTYLTDGAEVRIVTEAEETT